MKTHFSCPICKIDIEIRNEYLMVDPNLGERDRVGLSNKIFHMQQHKKVKLLKKKITYFEEKLKQLKDELKLNIDFLHQNSDGT